MEKQRPYWQVAVSLLFSLLATAGFILIGLKMVSFFLPFVIGWVIAMIAYPVVNWLEKRLKIVKKLGSALIVIIVLALIVLLMYLAVSKLVTEVSSLLRNFPSLYADLEAGLDQIGESFQVVFERLPESIQAAWDRMTLDFDAMMADFMGKISDPTVTAVGNFAKRVPSYLISVIVAILSAYFFTAEREEILTWLKKVSPPSVTKRMTLVSNYLKYAVGGYFRAQFRIMGVVFLLLLIAFLLLGIHYSVLIALLIAILDFFPFFGTGTALIPWAVYKFLVGDIKMAVMLIITYAVTQLVRQLIQPKMLGNTMGLNPLVTLILLYLGYRVRGVIGMILAVPIGMILINMISAGAFDYILNDVKILVEGILGLREEDKPADASEVSAKAGQDDAKEQK